MMKEAKATAHHLHKGQEHQAQASRSFKKAADTNTNVLTSGVVALQQLNELTPEVRELFDEIMVLTDVKEIKAQLKLADGDISLQGTKDELKLRLFEVRSRLEHKWQVGISVFDENDCNEGLAKTRRESFHRNELKKHTLLLCRT